MTTNRRNTSFTAIRGLAALSLCWVFGLAGAQEYQQPESDPPDRAARLSYLQGEVSLQPAGEEEWAAAILNRPLTTGDKLWTDQGARAEIEVGPAAVRLDGTTGFSFLNVDDNTIQMRVTAGVLNVSVRTLRDSEQIEIDTPNVALSLLRAGNYRVEVNDAGNSTVVKISEGAAQATGPSQDVVVHAQQVVTFNGVDELVAQYGTLGAPDDFDSWNLERDRRDERAANSRTAEYVAPEVTGYEDLEDNGTWSSEPDYGYVWTPTRIVVGWAPYRYGRWLWVSPWGWTWIDDARWGYAPFHYGRWAHLSNRWCWVPGPRHVRAVYAPALVGWSGAGVHVSWFPLGPREVYVPGRHVSRNYWERVNVSNTNVNRAPFSRGLETGIRDAVYRNRAVPGAVTAMPRTAFTSAGRTGDFRVRPNDPDLARGVATALAPDIAPVRESRMGGPARVNVRVPPQTVANRQVVVRRDPPTAAAHFARRPAVARDVAQTQMERPARPPARDNANNMPDRGNGFEATTRNRPDRPPRADQPAESRPPTQTSVFDRRAISDRVREDRDRQQRDGQQREALQQREARESMEQRESFQQRPSDQPRPQREQSQPSREQWHQERDRGQRPPDTERPAVPRERPVQRERNVEQPRVQQPRVEQPRVEQPRVEQPRTEQPRTERPSRSESQRPAESRPQRQQEGSNSRTKRD